MSDNIEIKNTEGIKFLKDLKKNSVDLILTDPPYIISKDSGMEKFKKQIKSIEEVGENVKTLNECDFEMYHLNQNQYKIFYFVIKIIFCYIIYHQWVFFFLKN